MKMTNYKTEDIKRLLTAFYDGRTSLDEERALQQYFETENIAPELQAEKIIFWAMADESEEINVPQSLEYQISRTIDKLDFEKKKTIGSNKKLWAWLSGIAASLVLVFSVGVFYYSQNKNTYFTNNQQITEHNLTEADKQKIHEAEAALVQISSKFNKGMYQLAMVEMNLETMNKNLNKINILTSKFNN
jgi:uncharacterized protein HemX